MSLIRRFRGTRIHLGAYGSLAALATVSVVAQLGGCSSNGAPSSVEGTTTTSAVKPTHIQIARGVHPLARPEFDVGPLDTNKRISNLSIVFKPTAEQVRDREALKDAILDPTSPSYHKWLTPEQYAERFGAPADVIARTKSWLSAQGLEVHEASRLGARVTFSGRVSDLQNAFHAEMHRYNVSGESHYAMATAPSIPADLAEHILAVHNTHDFYLHPAIHSAKVIDAPDYKNGTKFGIAPPDWAAIYDVNPLYTTGIGGTLIDGTGVHIAVVGISAVAQSDMDAFRTKFGLPASTVTINLVPNTGAAGEQGGAGVEAALDLEWSGGIAKGATINYVTTGATDGNVDDATYYAIEENIAPILSMSWGGCEYGVPQSDQDILQVFGSAANLLGITFLASSGDAGAASCLGFGLAGLYVNIPAAYPGVTSVGGTEFPTGGGLTYGGNGYATGYSTSETVWDESSTAASPGAGGGGISVVFPRPAYQSALSTCAMVGTLPVSVTPSAMRQVPDISASAAGSNNGIYIECTISNALGDCSPAGGAPKVLAIGGTSASAPALAGVVALIEQATGGRLGNINPMLYALHTSNSSAFHDITTGNNEISCTHGTDVGCPAGNKYGYAAAAGFDCATGLGSVDANNLVNAWAAAAPTTIALVPDATTTTEGTDVGLTATVTVPTTNANVLGGIVTFTFQTYNTDGTPDLSWTLAEKPITAGTIATGLATLSMPLPVGMIKPGQQFVDVVAMYGGDAHHLASTSEKKRITFSPISFCLSPSNATLAAGAAGSFGIVGGFTPVRYLINSDTTCDPATGNGCSTLDEATGAFVAGTFQAGYVQILALDKYGVEGFSQVTVGSPSGTPPWTGALGTCGTNTLDGGIPVTDSGTDSGNDSGSTGDDSGTTGDDDSGTTGDDDDSGSTSNPDASTGDDGGTIITPPPPDAGTASDASASDGGPGSTSSSSGCGCTTAGHSEAPSGMLAGLVLGLGLVVRRRRTRSE